MAWTSWRRPQLVAALGDGLTAPWNDSDGGISGDELSGAPAGFDEIYWLCNAANESELFSSVAYASGFNWAAEGIGINDRIDGIEVETTYATNNSSRQNGLRSLVITKTGFIEDSENKADRSLTGNTSGLVTVYGGEFDTWGVSGLGKNLVEAAAWGVFWRTEHSTTAGNRGRMLSMRQRLNVIPDGLLTGLTVNGLVAGGALTIYDDEDADPQNLGTSLFASEPCASSEIYTHSSPGNLVRVQHIAPGFKEINQPFTLGSTSETLTLFPQAEDSL